jgi:cytochrome P450
MKTTGTEPRLIKVRNRTYTLPPHTMIIPSYSALQTHPRHLGTNSLDWEPSRWITSPNPPPAASKSAGTKLNGILSSETFLEFPKEHNPFVAWGGGARICPGRKFSQVEFVGVLVGLSRKNRIRPLQLHGEDMGAARQRLRLLVKEDTGMRLCYS